MVPGFLDMSELDQNRERLKQLLKDAESTLPKNLHKNISQNAETEMKKILEKRPNKTFQAIGNTRSEFARR